MSDHNRNGTPATAKKEVRGTSKSNKRKPRTPKAHSLIRLTFLPPPAILILTLLLVTLFHFTGLLIFSKGFLLTRIALQDRASCLANPSACTLPPRHKRAIILIIDALRWDFIFPIPENYSRYSAYHHNVFTLPASLTAIEPRNSLLFKFIADPPTTTLQRIKGLTVGTLPTFIDAGSNFAASASSEDSWLTQAAAQGKRIAFMGDDTWLNVYNETEVFAPGLVFPFDSFNVEDLDTVDAGVVEHLFPLLESRNDWDILIGHSLGLDHVGHRLGSLHPEMVRKLSEANETMTRVIESLKEEDLLIVMGDHGMDERGNHGGDSQDEIEAGLWMYSKTPLTLLDGSICAPGNPLYDTLFPSNNKDGCFQVSGQKTFRSIDQISLVPTLSLLLGLPIPFSNLGTIITELFFWENASSGSKWKVNRGSEAQRWGHLAHALELNVHQIKNLLSKADLKLDLPLLSSINQDAKTQISAHLEYTRQVLKQSRRIWATFNLEAILIGLTILLLNILDIWRLYSLCKVDGCLWKTGMARIAVGRAAVSGLIAMTISSVALGVASFLNIYHKSVPVGVLVVSVLASEIGTLSTVSFPKPSYHFTSVQDFAALILPLVHGALFGSNSFTIWEDSILNYLLISALLIFGLYIYFLPSVATVSNTVEPKSNVDASAKGPTRYRLYILLVIAMISFRITSLSTVCREEQHPYCQLTFYPKLSAPIYTAFTFFVSFILAYSVSDIVSFFLKRTASLQSLAKPYLSWYIRINLILGSTYWFIEWILTTVSLTPTTADQLTTVKNIVAQITLTSTLTGATIIWYNLPLCLTVDRIAAKSPNEKDRVVVIGHSNVLGSLYLLFFVSIFAAVWILSQPAGQITLALSLIAGICLLEVWDDYKDIFTVARSLNVGNTFIPCSLLAIMGYSIFFATGHQANLPSIQWKTAFIGFKTVAYPYAPLLVIGNTYSGFVLSSLALPLIVLWKFQPSVDRSTQPLYRQLLQHALGFLLYHSLVSFSSIVFAAYFRRHLMVWKIFAPRFMLAGTSLLLMDIFVLLGIVVALITANKVETFYGNKWS